MKGSNTSHSKTSGRSRWSGLPCVFDLCLQLHRSGKIAEESLTSALPGCIACGACATLCPGAGIEIRDHVHERLILRDGEVVVRVRMEKCEGCGQYHVATILLEQVAKLVNYPKEVVDKNLCPACKRIALAAALTGNIPDFSWLRNSKEK
jgi:ferredoxin